MRRPAEHLAPAVTAAERASPEAIRRRLDSLTKPQGSLGFLETIALQLALIHGDPPPPATRRTVFVLAADHGVARRGVSAYPPEVTAQMCRNYARGGAAINVFARSVGASVVVADLGVDGEISDVDGIVHAKVRRGTRDLTEEPALRDDEVDQAIDAGARLVWETAPDADIVALGEMGIGNTTAASAIAALATGAAPDRVVGPGTGVAGPRLSLKRHAVERAVHRCGTGLGALDILAQVGGLEIAGLVGVALAAAARQRPVVIDGFISTAAALLAVRLAPAVRDYLFASHRSPEPGHAALLTALGLRPIFELDLRLGEGTGAVLALPVIEAAGAMLREMATFAGAGVATRISEEPTP